MLGVHRSPMSRTAVRVRVLLFDILSLWQFCLERGRDSNRQVYIERDERESESESVCVCCHCRPVEFEWMRRSGGNLYTNKASLRVRKVRMQEDKGAVSWQPFFFSLSNFASISIRFCPISHMQFRQLPVIILPFPISIHFRFFSLNLLSLSWDRC